ncbi:MAG TPA: RES family NAD+ phosphorylase [Longimicrobium sp.]|nr:RES family NAD+ phosphorylase [Longimicrobium sp.]
MTLPPDLPVSTLPATAKLWRVHRAGYDPLWFGPAPHQPPQNRFDAPAGEFRVCYFGHDLEGAFVETLMRGRANRLIALAELKERSATVVPLIRELRLARVHSDGLVHLAMSAAVPHADCYDDCHDLALSVWSHADAVDGIEYRSRWDDSRVCVALFDRAARALGTPSTQPLASTALVRPVMRHYGIGLS